jgi:hypothetical protein
MELPFSPRNNHVLKEKELKLPWGAINFFFFKEQLKHFFSRQLKPLFFWEHGCSSGVNLSPFLPQEHDFSPRQLMLLISQNMILFEKIVLKHLAHKNKLLKGNLFSSISFVDEKKF